MSPAKSSARPASPLDRLSAMAVFVRVVETGSFSRAARDLGIAQPTVSKQVAAIEARYAVRLLERTTRRVRPTDDGRAFYLQAKNLLAEFDELEAAARRNARVPGGKLRVTCPPALGRMLVAPLVFQYLAAHPDASIDLDLSARYLDPIEEGADVAIRIGNLADSSHRARLLGPSARVLVASPEYIARMGAPREPAELGSHEMLVYSYLPAPGTLKLHHPKRGATRVRVSGRLRVNNSEVLATRSPTAACAVCCRNGSRKAPPSTRSIPAAEIHPSACGAFWTFSPMSCAPRSEWPRRKCGASGPDTYSVMPALVAGIHVFLHGDEDVDGRDKPGHDEVDRSHV